MGDETPPVVDQTPAETSRIQCVQCGQELVVRQPSLEVLNGSTVSILSWAHSESQACPTCGLQYKCAIVGVGQVKVMWRPVKQPIGQSRITVPPPGFKLPKEGDGR